MNAQLKAIFNEGTIRLGDKEYELNSNIDQKEGEFIQSSIRDTNSKKTIEIGCAQGISSMFICEAIGDDIGAHHTIIDPYQTTEWESIGVKNLRSNGFSNFELIEQPSEIALPQLLSEGKLYDFAFIDGWHTFDHTLLDFFYLNRMLRVGGILIVDDVGLPSVNRVLRYILKYPSYQFYGNSGKIKQSGARRISNTIQSIISPLSRIFSEKVASEIFSDSIVNRKLSLKLRSSMVAIRKISEDERPWHWYNNF
jgi:predicted O-methyltransferase YrrM